MRDHIRIPAARRRATPASSDVRDRLLRYIPTSVGRPSSCQTPGAGDGRFPGECPRVFRRRYRFKLRSVLVRTLRPPKGFLRLIEGICPRHLHVCQLSFIKLFEVVTKPNTVPLFGEHSLPVAPTGAQTAYDDAK